MELFPLALETAWFQAVKTLGSLGALNNVGTFNIVFQNMTLIYATPSRHFDNLFKLYQITLLFKYYHISNEKV